jgi:hypothetical protein
MKVAEVDMESPIASLGFVRLTVGELQTAPLFDPR